MRSNFFKPNNKRKLKGILSSEQLKKIRSEFPDARVNKNKWNGFEIVLSIQPTAISEQYKILIVYMDNRTVKVFVVNKELKIANNRESLPHVYDSEKQQLCLYSPSKKEWDGYEYIVDTIIPWASEWLYYYELWLPEGKWYGGGHNEYPNEDFTKKIKNE